MTNYFQMFLLFAVLVVASSATTLRSTQRIGNYNTYYVYTRNNTRDAYQLQANVESIQASPLSAARNTTIVIHGHGATAFDSLGPTVKDAFITAEDINVILVDWSVYSSQSYSNAVVAVPGVATGLVSLIETLVNANVTTLADLHVVGFNLGAHIAGFTGRTFNGQIARVTGLDPSASQWGSNSQRLRSTDAIYVEVIHTNSGGLFSNGIEEALGHVDFYINNGKIQPGCLTAACSHQRAWEIFASSLTHGHLYGNQCNNMVQVTWNNCRGFTLPVGNNDLIKYGSGIFRVNTGSRYPF